MPALQERAEWVSASQVEMLGTRDDWDALIFPMKAIGRPGHASCQRTSVASSPPTTSMESA